MAQRSIEETFRQIKPRGQWGRPDAPVLEAGVGDTSDLSTALSQAGQQIQQMQAAWQQQAAAMAANTQAIQSNTSSRGSQSAGSVASSAASSVEHGLGLLGPLISGIASLFGGGSSTPAPLPVYVPPAPVSIDAALRSNVAPASGGTPASAPAGGSAAAAAPTINVNVTAMDSQSFMDRSADIASAVREAMLNLHPINDVVANL